MIYGWECQLYCCGQPSDTVELVVSHAVNGSHKKGVLMRRLLLGITAVLVFVGIVGTATTYSLALNATYVPGDTLFAVQDVSEQLWGVRFNGDSEDRAQVQLSLFAHRLDDLAVVQGTADEVTAVSAPLTTRSLNVWLFTKRLLISDC